MTYKLINFILFVFIQSIFINGVNQTFKEDMIFYKLGKWLDGVIKYDWIKLPLWKCVRCMSSFYGIITFLPLVIFIYGFHWIEFPILAVDIFSLVTVNYYIYKKV
jgi:hypothetical protein